MTNIYQPLEGAIPVVVQGTLLTGFLLVLSGVLIRRRIAATNGGIVPDEGFTLRNIFEVLVEMIADQADQVRFVEGVEEGSPELPL